MSRPAVSCEHLASLAHFDEVSFPSHFSPEQVARDREYIGRMAEKAEQGEAE